VVQAVAPPWTRAPALEPDLPVAERVIPEADPTASDPGAAEPEPAAGLIAAGPDQEPPAPVQPGPSPEPRPPVGHPEPAPGPAPGPAAGPLGGLDRKVLAWSLAGVALLGGAGLVLARARRREPAPQAPSRESSPDTITPEDLGRGSGADEDRLLALESRLDDEARSRTRVEDRLGQIQEDMKVVRDRLHRLSRRGPDSGE
jgi:hypothetical protein